MASWKVEEDEAGGPEHFPLAEAKAKQKELEKQVIHYWGLNFILFCGLAVYGHCLLKRIFFVISDNNKAQEHESTATKWQRDCSNVLRA